MSVSAVADYGHYFLGSIIISDKHGQKFIIDGQQRLTTLTLLLIYLQHAILTTPSRRSTSPTLSSPKVSANVLQPRRARTHALHGGSL